MVAQKVRPKVEPEGRFDFRDLEKKIRKEDQSNEEFAEMLGVNTEKIKTWRRNGIKFYTADRICTKLGIHPSEVWGSQYWDPTSLPTIRLNTYYKVLEEGSENE